VAVRIGIGLFTGQIRLDRNAHSLRVPGHVELVRLAETVGFDSRLGGSEHHGASDNYCLALVMCAALGDINGRWAG
jgi:alkanesulfonate monooxygenase SsuD/methylene tetrahydromethanopterin reductase-like flavin-dependent oxidoreductase (luciferase family)